MATPRSPPAGLEPTAPRSSAASMAAPSAPLVCVRATRRRAPLRKLVRTSFDRGGPPFVGVATLRPRTGAAAAPARPSAGASLTQISRPRRAPSRRPWQLHRQQQPDDWPLQPCPGRPRLQVSRGGAAAPSARLPAPHGVRCITCDACGVSGPGRAADCLAQHRPRTALMCPHLCHPPPTHRLTQTKCQKQS